MELFPTKGADFSPDSIHRYYLWRLIGETRAGNGYEKVLFIMLNPSTADADQDDPTIRRCIGYARSWGYHDLGICTLRPVGGCREHAVLLSRDVQRYRT